MDRGEKLIEWMEMDEEEKRKYNGFEGFVKGELFKDKNLFLKEDKTRLKRRVEKQKKNYRKKKLNKTKNKND